MYILFFYARRPVVLIPSQPSPSPLSPMITIDDSQPVEDKKRDEDQALAARQARLIVLEGQQAFEQSVFHLIKPEIKLGRNTAKETGNDIAIQDREISRKHARIFYRNQEFYIQDTDSRTGTRINGLNIEPSQDVKLENGTEIKLGPKVKLRFEAVLPPAEDVTVDDLQTEDSEDIDDEQTLYTHPQKQQD